MDKRLVFYLFTLFLIGCGSGPGDEATSSGSGGSGGSTSSSTTFSVYGSTSSSAYLYTHESTSFSAPCEIAGTAASQAINCYVEINEGDLYHQGLTFNYAIPSGMCMYLQYTPYWYYNQDIGYGPSTIAVNITKDASGTIISSDCSFDGAAAGSCATGSPEAIVDTSDLSVTCTYDRTEEGAKNCCLGDYTYTTHVDNNGTITDKTSIKHWGGNAKDCLGGTTRSNTSFWDIFDRDGFPISKERNINMESFSGTFSVRAPIAYPQSLSNIPIANYYTPLLNGHSAYALPLTSTKPFFVDPIDDLSGTLIPSGNPAYVFDCLDNAYETTHRISIYVREWDVYSDFIGYITGAGTPEVPDRRNTSESATCTGVGFDCNDIIDPDDFVSTLGTYSNTTPAQRKANFPFDDYSSF